MNYTIDKQNSDTIVLEFGVRGESLSEENRVQLSTQVAAFRAILEDFDKDPSCRAGIRGLTIRLLFLDGFSEEREGMVVNAFKYLPGLKTFRWACLDGVIPIADEIVEALARGKVEELFFPVTRIGDSDLSRLRGLTTLSLGLPSHERTKGYYHDHIDAFAEVQAQIVRANAPSVQDLAVTTSIRWECTLPALRNASISRLLNCSPAAMNRLLRTSPYLTSLTITSTEPADRNHTPLEVVFEAFDSAPDALPQLTSFKLLASPHDSGVTGVHEQILSEFLKNKRQLRCLHVTLSSGRRSFPYGRHVLEILPTLPHLEVLGVQLSCETLDTDELRFYDRHLPRDLTTLLVSARFDKIDISPDELLSLFTTRTKLKTLTLVPATYPTFRALDDALNPLLFDNRPPSLDFLEWAHCSPDRTRTLVGFCSGPERHNIFCPSSRGGRPFARKPLPNECGLEDWAWLREYDETHTLSPDTGFELERCNYQGTVETAMDVDAAKGENEDDDEIDRITEHIDIRRIEGICYETS
ncbi:hypothetical protein GSI_14010 [Ganoderma sinense ZZ0214-1]|uniref:Uncharacterized protein n=1 Tax=Ganoderma sinense ZZ0214-1 TaxID=1077348 RepID=A0A2G8RRW3_9APHY|nr:hypothetical protein GSI_14010 [Ganoderma sinense ZZ0214-1]